MDDFLGVYVGENDVYDYFAEENKQTKEIFNLDEILEFQLKHDVQIIRGSDYMYICYIDKGAYGSALTPMFALAYGIKCYKEMNLNAL